MADAKSKVKVLLQGGEVVLPGTLLRLGCQGAFLDAGSQEYDALKFMALSCEAVDLGGKPWQPIWAEIPTCEESSHGRLEQTPE